MKIFVDKQNKRAVTSIKLLGVEIYDKLNFNLHVSNICKSATDQLSAMIRLKNHLSFDARKLLINKSVSLDVLFH